jgi:nicotinate phosphoribosyltransferase
MDPGCNPLLTDLYQLNMIEAYLAHGETNTAIFELFVRELPRRRGFLMAAGLEQALKFLEDLRFTAEEIDWLKSTGRFSARTLNYLAELPLRVKSMPCRKGRYSSPTSQSCE